VRFNSGAPRFGDHVSPADFAYGNWMASRGSTLLTQRDRGVPSRSDDGASSGCGCHACAEGEAQDWERSITLTAESERDALLLQRIVDALRELGTDGRDDDFAEDDPALDARHGARKASCGCHS
jgi:hypothetical protein